MLIIIIIIILFSVLIASVFLLVGAGHYIIPYQQPYDAYHDLHLPHEPPLFPTYSTPPRTSFGCKGKAWGLYADEEAGCQAFHLCLQERLISTHLCTNGTLFNEQFQVCDQFYNVRCGIPLEDL